MKIAFFYRDLFRPGGIPREIHLFMSTLVAQGHEVWGLGYGGDLPAQAGSQGLHLERLKPPRQILFLQKESKLRLRSLVHDEKVEVLFVVGGHIPENYAVCACWRRSSIPYIFSPGGAYTAALLRRRRVRKLAWRIFERRVVNWASAIRVYSPINAAQVRRLFPSVSVITIKEGVDREELASHAEAEPFPPGKLHVLYVGRIDLWGKGLDESVKAFGILQSRGAKVFFHIVGPVSDSEKAGFSRALSRLSADVFRYYGPVFGPSRFRFFRAADIFLYASRHEGIPRAAREALAIGLPLIVTPETNVSEDIVRAKAGYSTGCDAAEIAAHIERHAGTSEHERASMRRNARRLAEEVYDWPRICKDFTRVWEMSRRDERT